jgi:hypothetical protein
MNPDRKFHFRLGISVSLHGTHLLASIVTHMATKMNGAALYTLLLSHPQNTALNLSFLEE